VSNDLEHEKFQHEVRVAAAYLNLLAAQKLKVTQQKNMERAAALRNVVLARTKNGLNPGVDSSLANAEVSNAKIALTNAADYEAEQAGQLAQLMGDSLRIFALDTFFVSRIPSSLFDTVSAKAEDHPLLKFFKSRLESSRAQEKYYNRFKYPVFSLVGIYQSRGSGFHEHYSEADPSDFTKSYWNGISPSRQNYLIGMGVTWNLTGIKRTNQQVMTQQWTSRGLQDELELVNRQLSVQLSLADQKIKNAISNATEAPVQLKAATDAYLQKSVLYKNGLANIVDITQALFTLNRAEIDREISFNNVWQALLLKAAATGDFNLFLKEF
jgi:outer membrane protein TolC